MKNLILLLLIFISFYAKGQVTGYWYGQANVEVEGIQNNYLTELIISQKGNKVKGFFGYYFKDVYQSFVVKGTYDPKTHQLVINNIPIIYFLTNSTANSVDCITSFQGTLRVSRVKTELLGYFLRDKKYTYTCPDLRVNYTLYTEAKVTDSIFKDMAATRSFWKPQPPAPDVVKGNGAQQESAMAYTGTNNSSAKPVANKITTPSPAPTSATKSTATSNTSAATVPKTTAPPAVATAINTKTVAPAVSAETDSKPNTITVQQLAVPPDILKIKEEFVKRKQVVSQEIEVSSDSVRLSFYDNGEIDGDSISVFLNGKMIVAHQLLLERAFNVYVQLDSTLDINEVSMFAENLGKIPPNTALMVISDGDKRYETFLSSDFKGNATVRLKVRRNALAGN
jgi:hypothetical protein